MRASLLPEGIDVRTVIHPGRIDRMISSVAGEDYNVNTVDFSDREGRGRTPIGRLHLFLLCVLHQTRVIQPRPADNTDSDGCHTRSCRKFESTINEQKSESQE